MFRLNSEIIFQNITKQKHKKGASKLASMGGSHNPFTIGEGRGPHPCSARRLPPVTDTQKSHPPLLSTYAEGFHPPPTVGGGVLPFTRVDLHHHSPPSPQSAAGVELYTPATLCGMDTRGEEGRPTFGEGATR